MAPLLTVRRTQRWLSSRKLSPILVPPLQSTTRSATRRKRGVWAPTAELPGNSGEPGSEDEDFEGRATSVQGMGEPQHEAAVPLHRSTDVTYQDDRPRDRGALEPTPAERLPSGAE